MPGIAFRIDERLKTIDDNYIGDIYRLLSEMGIPKADILNSEVLVKMISERSPAARIAAAYRSGVVKPPTTPGERVAAVRQKAAADEAKAAKINLDNAELERKKIQGDLRFNQIRNKFARQENTGAETIGAVGRDAPNAPFGSTPVKSFFMSFIDRVDGRLSDSTNIS